MVGREFAGREGWSPTADIPTPGRIRGNPVLETGGKAAIHGGAMPPLIYLMRHGETEWSKSGQHTGRTEVPLTPDGQDSARELGERLQRIQFSAVLCSPRLRARQTCELAGMGLGMEIEPDLTEWEYGEYEGLRSVEILAGRPDWNVFRNGCPGGEDPGRVSDRADRVISRLSTLEGNVAVFSHGHFGRALATRWIQLPIEEGRHLLLDPASVSLLGYEHDRADSPAIVMWNSSIARL